MVATRYELPEEFDAKPEDTYEWMTQRELLSEVWAAVRHDDDNGTIAKVFNGGRQQRGYNSAYSVTPAAGEWDNIDANDVQHAIVTVIHKTHGDPLLAQVVESGRLDIEAFIDRWTWTHR